MTLRVLGFVVAVVLALLALASVLVTIVFRHPVGIGRLIGAAVLFSGVTVGFLFKYPELCSYLDERLRAKR